MPGSGSTLDEAVNAAGAPIQIGVHAAFPLPKNGRQLARRSDGLWFLTYASHSSSLVDSGARATVGLDGRYGTDTEIRVRASKTSSPVTTADFGTDHVLVRKSTGYTGPTPATRGHVIGGEGGENAGGSPSMTVDPHDVLHLVWSREGAGEVWYARCDVSGPAGPAALGRSEAWHSERLSGEDAALGDICLDGEDRPCLVFRNRQGILFSSYQDGWKSARIAAGEGLESPVLARSRSGTLHVVWRNSRRHLLYLRSSDGGKRWTNAAGGNAPDFLGGYCHEAPSLAAAGGEVLVAHYQNYRVVTYSHYDGRKWRQNTVVPDSYNHNSPMLAVDRHDVIWMHAVFAKQEWTMVSRWLGEEWADWQEGRRTRRMANTCSAQREAGDGRSELGILLADRDHRLYFDTIRSPAPEVKDGENVMLLDLWEVGRIEGVEQVVEPLEKDQRNPILKHGEEGSWDGMQANFEGTIFKDGDRYRLWYTGLNNRPYFDYVAGCGYAESADGVNWVKPNLGIYAYKGNKNNNICYDQGFAYGVLKVPEEVEPNPARRYRMTFSTGRGASLAFSPDGIHWTLSDSNPLWTAGRAGDEDEHIAENSTYLYDPFDTNPDRRFKAFPQTAGADGLRTVGLMVSPDGIHFKRYANNPVIDAAPGVERQNHYLKVYWRRHGMYIGIYGCYFDQVNVDARLIVSRDGIHWVRVKKQVAFLPTGTPESWDAGMVFPSNYPIVDGEDVWIYYSGVAETFASGEGYASTGRARVRLDGFAKVQLREGRRSGSLTTVPLSMKENGVRVTVNADQLARGRRTLRVEVLDVGTGQIVPGYSASDCDPLEQDGVAIPVRWGGRITLSGIEAKEVRLRFVFSGTDGTPRLCSFGFA